MAGQSGSPIDHDSCHLVCTDGLAPTAVNGPDAGAMAPPPLVAPGSTDTRGSLTFGTGTGGPSGGLMVSVQFAVSFATPPVVITTEANLAAFQDIQKQGCAAVNVSAAGFDLWSFVGVDGLPNTTYAVTWQAIG